MPTQIKVENICKEKNINKTKVKQIINHILQEEKVRGGDIGVIFVDDPYIKALNKQFLKRDGTTDVLSFPLTEEGSPLVEGEIYISLDRAAQQAQDYHVTFENEVLRLVIHGLLHLLDYRNDVPDKKNLMKEKEDFFLSELT